MKPFEACSPTVEVNGETVLAVVAGMGSFAERAHRILASHGIQDPKPGTWHKQQAWLNAFKEIAERLGPATLYQIGMKIPEMAKFPPEIKTIEQALGSIDRAYKMNHRGGEIGSYEFQSTSQRSGQVVCRNPYPSEFDRGIIHAMANRFKPEGGFVQVDLDGAAPNRKTGGEACTFKITW